MSTRAGVSKGVTASVERLSAAVDRLSVGVDPDELTALLAERDRLEARVADVVGRFDAAEPGILSAGQVEVIVSRVKPRHLALFAEHEAALVPVFAPLGIDELASAVNDWCAKADAVLDTEPPEPAHSTVQLDAVGERHRLHGDLDGDDGVIDAPALAALELRELGISTQTDLDDLLATWHTSPALRAWYQSGLHTLAQRPRAAARTLGGHDLSPALAAAFCCDSTISSSPTRRTAPDRASLRVAPSGRAPLAAESRPPLTIRVRRIVAGTQRARSARSVTGPGGERNGEAWAYHHHVLHRDGWSAHLQPDGTLVVADPRDRTWHTRPPGPANGPPHQPLTLGA